MPFRPERLHEAFAGRYHVERELGAGGMATVYLARDPRQARAVAIKVMRPEVSQVLGSERFAREVAIAGALAHPNILPVFDSGTVTLDGVTVPFYVMPFVEGETLRARLQRERQLPADDALRIVRAIGGALDFAHAHGVVHRDVKPENILLVEGTAILADFGVARAVHGAGADARLTGTGISLGTPAYMSPEQAAADPALDGRSDLYSLAIVAYEMLGGQPPFTGVTPQAVLARQLSGEVLPLRTVRPRAVSEAMDLALARALAPAPADRFATVRAFVEALDGAGPQRRPLPPPLSPGRRATLVGIAALVAGAAWLAIARGPAAAADGRVGVALMPFRTMADASEWAETLPDLVATFLDGTPGVRIADPWALWRPLRGTGTDRARTPDPEEAERLARRAGIARFVLGSVVRSGPRLDLTLRVYGVGAAEPIATFTLAGSVDSTAQLAQRTAVEVLRHVWDRGMVPSVPRMETLFSQMPEALKAYLAAREAMRRGLPDSADAAITRAIALDSTFAVAQLEAVSIKSWVQSLRGQPYSGLRELAARARAHADSFTPRQRLRLDATIASIETDGPRAAAAWQELLAIDSLDLDATRGLAYATLAYGWQYGGSEAELVRTLERAIRLDSTDVPTLAHRAAAALGRWDPADVAVQRARLAALGPAMPMVRANLRAIDAVTGSDAAFAVALDSLARGHPIEWVTVLRALRAYHPDRAVRLGEATLRLAAPGMMQDLAVSALSSLQLAAGDVRAADATWRAAPVAATPAGRLRHAQRIVAAALVGVEAPEVTARALDDLARLVPIDSALPAFARTPAWAVAWTLGAWHATRGDTLLARRWLGIIPRFPAGGAPATWREAIAADVASRLAERRGHADSARALAARAFAAWTVHTPNVGDSDIEPALRFRHAQALLAAGLADSAVRILGSFVPPVSWIGVYVVPAHLSLAAAAERRGARSVAARHFDEASQLLALGGPAAAASREAARAGAERTGANRLVRYGRGP